MKKLFFSLLAILFATQGWSQTTPATLPWTCDFENPTENANWIFDNGSCTNKWVIGTAVSSSVIGGKSLYISDNNGTSNTYTAGGTGGYNVVIATREIESSGADSYILSFDWICRGESTYDFFRVFLVDASNTSFVASNSATAPGYVTDNAFASRNNFTAGSVAGVVTTNPVYPAYANILNGYNGSSMITANQHMDVILPSMGASGTIQKLIIVWRQDASGGANPPAALDNFSIYPINCGNPTALTVSSVTHEVSWTSDDSEWLIEYKPAADSWADPSVQSFPVYTTPTFTLSGLTLNTTYDIRVRTVCGTGNSLYTDFSDWATFTMFFPRINTVPYNQDFEDLNNVAEWRFGSSTVNKWVIGSATGNSGNSMYISNDNGIANAYTTNTTTYASASIVVDFGNAPEYHLSFDWKANGESIYDFLRVYTVPVNYTVPTDGFPSGAGVTQLSQNYMNQQSSWQHTNFTISNTYSGTVQKLVFLWRNDDNGGSQPPASVDNISISPVICLPPTALTVSPVTHKASWSSDGNEWLIECKPAAVAWTDPSVQSFTASDTFYTLPLALNTTYDVRVRTVCGTGNILYTDFSDWTAPVTVYIPTINTVPYNQDFEDLNNVAEWQFGSSSVNKWVTGSATGNSGNSMYISNDNGVTNAYNHTSTYAAASIVVNFGNAPEHNLSFDWKANGESIYDFLRVYIVPVDYTIPASSLPSGIGVTQLSQSYMNLQTTWQHANFTISDTYSGTVQKLVFLWRNDDGGGVQPPAAVDNISITPVTCLIPTALTVSPVTHKASWSSDGNEWLIECKPAAVAWTDPSVQSFTASDTFYTLPLALNTTYDVRVRTVCGTGNILYTDFSDWTAPVTVYIPTINTVPYNQDFEDLNNVAEWQFGSSSVNKWVTGSATGNSGNSMYISNDNGVTNAYNHTSTYATASIVVDFGNAPEYNLSFDWKANGESTYDFLRVYIVPVDYTIPASGFPSGTGVTQLSQSYMNQQTTWQHAVFAISDTYSGTVQKLVFLWYNDDGGGSQPPAAVDNISIAPVTCLPPTALTVSPVTHEVSWTSDGNEWLIEYKPASAAWTDPSVQSVPVYTTPAYTLSNLALNTTYDVRVRAVCGTGNILYTDFSDWTAVAMFFPIINTVPYNQDFEDLNNTAEWQFSSPTVNKWVAGSATGNSGNSIYISDDNGVTNAYEHTATHAAASVVVDFGNFAEYTLSFDWKANGESTYDFLRVYIVPVDYAIPASSLPSGTGVTQLSQNYMNLQTSWQHADFIISGTYSGTVQKLVFLWRNDGGGGAQPPAAVDNISLVGLTCGSPQNFVATQNSPTSVHLNWSEATNVVSRILEYKKSTETTWTVEPNVTAPPYILSSLDAENTYNFRLKFSCGETDESIYEYSDVYIGYYCLPTFTGTTTLYNTTSFTTTGATITNLNDDTPCTALTYYSRTSLPFTAEPSDVINFTATFAGGTHGIAIWIDFNQNYIFEAGERVYNTSNYMSSPHSGTITIPASTPSGTYGMRVQIDGNTPVPSNPCQNVSGNIIDYHLELRAEICTPPINVTVSNPTTTTATVSWQQGGSETEWIIEYAPAGGNYTPVNTSSSPHTLTGLQPNTTYTLRMKSVCGNTTSTPSASHTFTTPSELCDEPANLTTVETSHTITISWQPMNGETQWKILYGTAGFSGQASVTGNPSYTLSDLLSNTTYRICVIAICAPEVESASDNCINVTTLDDVGIPDGALDNSVKLYPNPAADRLTVETESQFSTIEIINILGQAIYKADLTENQTLIDLRNYSAGIYYVKLQSNNGMVTKKFVKE